MAIAGFCLWLVSIFIMLSSGHAVESAQRAHRSYLSVGDFSSEAVGEHLPAGWKEIRFNQIAAPTRYMLVSDDGIVVLKAESRNAASGIYRPVSVIPQDYPILKWRWKVTRIFENEDLTAKSKDDYPVRLYILFEDDRPATNIFQRARRKAAQLIYGDPLPGSSLVYIWSAKTQVGTIAASPYSERARLFVVDCGTRNLGEWVEQRRNVENDYQKAYGRPAPSIIGIALMTDTDNTANHAESLYGDIFFTTNF